MHKIQEALPWKKQKPHLLLDGETVFQYVIPQNTKYVLVIGTVRGASDKGVLTLCSLASKAPGGWRLGMNQVSDLCLVWCLGAPKAFQDVSGPRAMVPKLSGVVPQMFMSYNSHMPWQFAMNI